MKKIIAALISVISILAFNIAPASATTSYPDVLYVFDICNSYSTGLNETVGPVGGALIYNNGGCAQVGIRPLCYSTVYGGLFWGPNAVTSTSFASWCVSGSGYAGRVQMIQVGFTRHCFADYNTQDNPASVSCNVYFYGANPPTSW